jgi:hypothetical protein
MKKHGLNMKKILLFLTFILMSIGVWGAELTYTHAFSTKPSSGDNTLSTITWTTSNITNLNAYNNGYAGVQVGTSNKTGSITFTSKYNWGEQTATSYYGYTKVKYVYVWLNNGSGTISATVTIGGKSATKTGTVSKNTTANGDYTNTSRIIYTPASNGTTGTIVIAVSTSSKAGYIAAIQVVCETPSTPLPSLYTVTYKANGGSGTMTDSNSPYNSGATVTVLANTFTRDNYTFDRWNTAANGSGADYDADDTFTITSDATLYAQWIENTPTPPTPTPVGRLIFELLTDINDLHDGDSIIILDKDNTYAMSVDNGNNRAGSNTFDVIDNIVEVTDSTVQILRADTIGNSNFWRLSVGDDAVLYAASSSSNHLKTGTKSTSGDNGKWKIILGSGGDSIIAQGNNTRNRMEYNESAELFACYEVSNQTLLKIYKKIPCDEIYSVLFMNNYSNYDTIDIPSCVRRLHELPTNPSNAITACNSSAEFAGWSKAELTGDNEKPDDIFKTLQNSPYINSNDTFHAVFAIKNNSVESPASIISVFKTKGWGDFDNLWTSNKDGYSKNSQGVQVTIATSDAGATTRNSYYKITNIIVTYSTNTSTGAGTITVNIGDVELEGDGDVVVLPEKQGKTDRNITYTPNEPLTGMVRFSVTCSEKSIYIKSIQINYTDYEYDFYQTYCTDTLKSGSSWNSGTWSLNRAPQSNERAVILQPVTVDIPHARAKEVVISPNGKLTVQPNKGLEVQDTISVHDGTYRATTPENLILQSSEAGNASLIFNNNNKCQATVELYSIANSKKNWQYMGTVMDSLNALYNYYGSWIYRWDESQQWKAVPNGGMMYAWTGYCLTQEKATSEWYETTGTLIPTDTKDTTLTVPARGDMVFTNSWTAPIHISKFYESGFKLTPMNIYLFNTGYAPRSEGGSHEYKEGEPEAGTHIVVPVHAAPYLKDTLIAPQQGFFVSNTTDSSGYITMNYNTLVRGFDSIVAGKMRAPRRTTSSANKPDVLKIYANGSVYSDNVVILAREDFSAGFDNGWDGGKSSFGTLSPSIYVVNNDGSYDAVSAIPELEGALLGFRPGTDISYSMTFEYDGDEIIYLNDILTQTSTLIDNESRYVFTSDGTEEVRFVISETPYSGVATDIDNLSEQSNDTHKFLYNGNLYILKNNCIFNIVGSLVK